MEIEKRVNQILRGWNRKAKTANKVKGDIRLIGAKMQDLFLAYSLMCGWGYYYKPYFVIASRNQDAVRTANAVNECNFIEQIPYWAWEDNDYTYDFSRSLPSKLEHAVASFYSEEKIPEEIKNEIIAHNWAINVAIEHCSEHSTDYLRRYIHKEFAPLRV